MLLADQIERARALLTQGLRPEALQICHEILTLKPADSATLNELGVLLGQLSQLDPAIACFDAAIALEPTRSAPYCNRGLALLGLQQPQSALVNFDRAIELEPTNTLAHYARGNVLSALDRSADALKSYDDAIALNPGFPQAYFGKGIVLQQIGHYETALSNYEQALRVKPDYAEAHANRAFVLSQLRRFPDAIQAYDVSISLKPGYAPSYLFRGNAFKELHQFDAALVDYDQAILLDPAFAAAYCNRGVLLQQMRNMEAALASYDQAIRINPQYAEAFFNRGSAYREIKRIEAAASDYDAAASLDPNIHFLPGLRLETRMHLCDWTYFEIQAGNVCALVERGLSASHPFALLASVDSPKVQRKCAETWANEAFPFDGQLGAIGKIPRPKKIRIGYFSPDFREHPVARLISELIETHDRSKFEVIAFSFGIAADDEMRQRLKKSFDSFYVVSDKSDLEVAVLARSLNIDIAVDLAGYTHNCRPGIFALRAAPIQIGYLGYLGTMGASYIDYIIADSTIIPANQEEHYSEKILFLPIYQANDSRRIMSNRSYTRTELGIPAASFAFSCFNSNFKFTPAVFSVWMKILERVKGSVLFLTPDNLCAQRNLVKTAQSMGVSAERLIFGERLPLPDYLARFQALDLFLDTLPYNAGTTASDALWAGLPVLTCKGSTFAGRVAASLLHSLEMPELVAATLTDYQEIAIRLGSNPDQMKAVKDKLNINKHSHALFNTARFTADLERGYTLIVDRYFSGLSTAHIHVDFEST